MALIGVLGEKSQEAARLISEWLERAGETDKHTLIDLERTETERSLDILVALDNSRSPYQHIAALGEHSILIMNPDHKDILAQAAYNRGLLITYGFNSKDCVTASSVTDNEMQICIQRDLPTLNGGAFEQQEFGIFEDMEHKDPEVVLAALTAVFICDVHGEQLQVLN